LGGGDQEDSGLGPDWAKGSGNPSQPIKSGHGGTSSHMEVINKRIVIQTSWAQNETLS
jgi:hypothetical protein